MSAQSSGLYGPNLETCQRCDMGGMCMTERGEPKGQGCGYTAFGQFQCALSSPPRVCGALPPGPAPAHADGGAAGPRALSPAQVSHSCGGDVVARQQRVVLPLSVGQEPSPHDGAPRFPPPRHAQGGTSAECLRQFFC